MYTHTVFSQQMQVDEDLCLSSPGRWWTLDEMISPQFFHTSHNHRGESSTQIPAKYEFSRFNGAQGLK